MCGQKLRDMDFVIVRVRGQLKQVLIHAPLDSYMPATMQMPAEWALAAVHTMHTRQSFNGSLSEGVWCS